MSDINGIEDIKENQRNHISLTTTGGENIRGAAICRPPARDPEEEEEDEEDEGNRTRKKV